MNQKKTTNLVLAGTILFHLLFWKEKMGVNILLFTLFIIGAFASIYSKKEISKAAIFTTACTLLLATMVVVNHSILSMVMFEISFVSMIGFIHQKELSFFFYGAFQSLLRLEAIPKKIWKEISTLEEFISSWKRSLAFARISILPLLVLGIFYGLYYSANPKFATLSTQTWTVFFDLFNWHFSIGNMLFFILGMFIVGVTLWKADIPHLVRLNHSHSETLVRVRKKREFSNPPLQILALKKQYQSAVLMVASLNFLLLLVNLIDVRFVWFDFEEQPAYSLKNYVHEGTYLLIASILLAMGIIIYYFRGNLNFYKKNKTLQYFTYAWIFQNAILAYSVGMRNYRYIEYHGLAYKRIGVVIFLIAVIFGLVTMFKKVQEQRSFYYLINRNAWAVYILLVLTSLVNWDVAITRYNILTETKRTLDIDFLANGISDKNLFLLKKYNNEIKAKLPSNYPQSRLDNLYAKKKFHLLEKRKKYSWLSWNYSDYRNYRALEGY
ncbi:MAG TPA: DUF4173 domain-containing protein [Phaeodactylibacter sp.]|nr:DUF4173 domain-containing protein [Phaeodactylibacter sp.]